MFSLQKLLGKDDMFFDLLTASAEAARQSIVALERILMDPVPRLDGFVAARREDKRITTEISEKLARTYVTQLEREDIEELASKLYKIPKTVEKFAERYHLSSVLLRSADFSAQTAIISEAMATVCKMIGDLRSFANQESVRKLNAQLQKLEGRADDLILELLGKLYEERENPVRVVITKDLYELLEKIVDHCRDTGNVVSQIMLKHS